MAPGQASAQLFATGTKAGRGGTVCCHTEENGLSRLFPRRVSSACSLQANELPVAARSTYRHGVLARVCLLSRTSFYYHFLHFRFLMLSGAPFSQSDIICTASQDPFLGWHWRCPAEQHLLPASEVWCMVPALTKNGYRSRKPLLVIWGACDIHSQDRRYSSGQGLSSLQAQLGRRGSEE